MNTIERIEALEWEKGVIRRTLERRDEEHEECLEYIEELQETITYLVAALRITMEAYHNSHPKYFIAEKALKKARMNES